LLKDPNRLKRASIYFLVVLIPSLLINTCIYFYQKDKVMDLHRSEAAFMINIHKSQIDNLIQDTKARLESMALVLEEEKDEDKIQRVLMQAYDQEPRFSGLYFVHKNGDITAGSRKMMKTVNLQNRAFFKSAIATKQSTVSDAYFGNITGGYIVSVCTPIFNEKGEVTNLLVAALKVDYLKNIMNVISPRLNIKVVNESNHVLFTSGSENEASKLEPVRVYLDQIAWKLEGVPDSEISLKHAKDMIIYMLITFGILNIIFILIQNFLLKRRALIEQSQIDAQKVELVGMLAASTAHEIRNPLTGVKGFIQLLQEKYQDSEDQFYFSVIDKEIQRINEIVSEFLVLGKPTADHHADHDINAIVLELSPLLGSEANLYNTEMDIRLYKEPLLINCTKDHIKQVLLNLAKNSLEAIDKNEGRLTIEVQKQGDFALIRVIDTGKGIPEDVISKIFHPFFTMKDTGTGLGLVVCKRIISMYKGTIAIDSVLDRGTKVTIALPLSEKE
jgi:two-component system, sporulation sensor kinase D